MRACQEEAIVKFAILHLFLPSKLSVMPNSIVCARSHRFAVRCMIFGIAVLWMLELIYNPGCPAKPWLVFSNCKQEFKDQNEIGHTMGFEGAPDLLVNQKNARYMEVKALDCAELSPDKMESYGAVYDGDIKIINSESKSTDSDTESSIRMYKLGSQKEVTNTGCKESIPRDDPHNLKRKFSMAQGEIDSLHSVSSISVQKVNLKERLATGRTYSQGKGSTTGLSPEPEILEMTGAPHLKNLQGSYSPASDGPGFAFSATSMRPTPILRSLQTPLHTPAPTIHFNLTSDKISAMQRPKQTNSVKERGGNI